jgi:UDP-N-acetylmuramyl pentapeptide phosphotransferase/UDP-N-acetylglucosamine-1-phosphate transferase
MQIPAATGAWQRDPASHERKVFRNTSILLLLPLPAVAGRAFPQVKMIVSVQMILAAITIAAAASAALIAAILPLLRQHALAHPIARSSHLIPTPQGAGIGVVAATVGTAGIVLALWTSTAQGVLPALAAALALAAVGAIDDFRNVAIVPRLMLQAAAVVAMLLTVPAEAQIAPFLPLWVERAILFFAGLWFVNLVNFMDGIDWITVAEVVPVTAALAAFGLSGHLSPAPAVVAAALCGAYLGFAPFNRPVAKVFLGDVGSLPTGLLLAWCLIDLAAHGQAAAALLLPLYYLTDATITLLRRLTRGERFWLAHRSHFYQQATDNGLSALQVVGHVFALNLVLAALAAITVATPPPIQIAALAAGLGAVAFVLRRFARSH